MPRSLCFQVSLILSVLWVGCLESASLVEQTVYTLKDGVTYYLKSDYCELETEEFITNALCFCFSSDEKNWDCSVPGPTLKMYAGSQPKILMSNNLINTYTDEYQCGGRYCEMDVTNIHTHGMHVSAEQDNVLLDIFPRTSANAAPNTHLYEYTIPDEHYPGIHWYHPHNDGSVSWQTTAGLIGALITEYNANDQLEKYPDSKLNTDSADAYVTNVLVFTHMFLVDTANCLEYCDDLDTLPPDFGHYGRCDTHGKQCFFIFSFCYEYCSFDEKEESLYEYSVEFKDDSDNGDGYQQYFLVNGQINPSIDDVTAGKWRRLQFVVAGGQYYYQYKFDDRCDWILLGYDGVFFREDLDSDGDAGRDLTTDPYNYELLLAPGSRADILVNCPNPNTDYTVVTSQNNVDSSLQSLERAGSDPDHVANGASLFTISTVSNGIDVNSEAPDGFPRPPQYLMDLTQANIDYSEDCACNTYAEPSYKWDRGEGKCRVGYNSKNEVYTVNGVSFHEGDAPLTYLLKDRVYEFELFTDRHANHFHVYPYQIQEDVCGGFVAQKGDWFDTYGAPGSTIVRLYTCDFAGYQVLHCHLLPHEDEGMMGFHYVIQDATEWAQSTIDSSSTAQCLNQLVEDSQTDQAYDSLDLVPITYAAYAKTGADHSDDNDSDESNDGNANANQLDNLNELDGLNGELGQLNELNKYIVGSKSNKNNSMYFYVLICVLFLVIMNTFMICKMNWFGVNRQQKDYANNSINTRNTKSKNYAFVEDAFDADNVSNASDKDDEHI